METGNKISFRWVEDGDTKFLHIGRPQFRNGTYLCQIQRDNKTGMWYVVEDGEGLEHSIIENLDPVNYCQEKDVEKLKAIVENYFF